MAAHGLDGPALRVVEHNLLVSGAARAGAGFPMASMSVGCSAAALMVSGLILGPILAGEAQAQNIDHYQCYKAKQIKGVCQDNLSAACKTTR